MRRYKHLTIKAILILVAEVLVMLGSWLYATYVHPLEHTLRVNVVAGIIVAIAVILLHNRYLWKKKAQVEKELKDLQDVVLKKLPDQDKK